MTKKQILEILLPYKENVENCAVVNNNCLYLTEDGKKCAVGKMLKEGVWQRDVTSVKRLLEKYGREILEEKYQDVHIDLLIVMQQYHDDIAGSYGTKNAVEKLENITGYKFPELR